jgi:lipopolysaccharide transport system ATP-binding protein
VAVLLQVKNATKSYGNQVLLDDAEFTLVDDVKVGFVGRNGAGKSTLLKILSRITEPTTGQARVRGRIASLLEVGTGFHPELSGRENIYLNGAILGMTRAEVKAKFDEIVAFAEVERFLDTPVKRYSSGMYVRLAFAVAAHLEPEILIVDEVLAVGDHSFQQKCMGKMHQINNQFGRTVILVSHNMASIDALCHRSILLHDGVIHYDGPPGDSIKKYLSLGLTYRGVLQEQIGHGRHTKIHTLQIIDSELSDSSYYNSNLPLHLRLRFETDGTRGISFDFYVSDSMGNRIYFYSAALFDAIDFPVTPGVYEADCIFKPLLLASGRYVIDAATSFTNVEYDHYVPKAATFEVSHYSPGGRGWNFSGSEGYGTVAMAIAQPITLAHCALDSLIEA